MHLLLQKQIHACGKQLHTIHAAETTCILPHYVQFGISDGSINNIEYICTAVTIFFETNQKKVAKVQTKARKERK